MSSLDRWRSEKQAAWIYGFLARLERNEVRSRMFTALAKAAEEQAEILRGDVKQSGADTPPFRTSLRARTVVALTRRFGIARTKTMLAALKVRGLSAYGVDDAGPEHSHPMPVSVGDIGARHRSHGGGGVLRAAVFGVNDGLVSNTSLILGMTGASVAHSTVLVTGAAGLLAGAFSMAAGEYISMRSQRELFEYQIAEERDELERYPEEETEELALIYAGRCLSLEAARETAAHLARDKERMLDTLAREELGLNPDDLGSPLGAAVSSFVAFAVGAVVPLVPFFFASLARPLTISCAAAAAGLFVVGAVLSLFSGRNAFYGGARMLAIGALAGLATWGIGTWIGVAVS
jgi:VIT1/CCC1 family predicted Fe2+/Mn2+ transporter